MPTDTDKARDTARRNLLDQLDPDRKLTPEQAQAAVDHAWRLRLVEWGQKGAATNAANAAALRNLRDNRDTLVRHLERQRDELCAGLDHLIADLQAIGGGDR